MAQQLPLVQIPMPQQPSPQAIAQGYNQPPLQPLYQQAQQPQMQSEMPDFVNDPNIDINTKRQLLNQYNNQQPQVVSDVSPQSMAVAGANQNGVDWGSLLGTLGSYVAAAGSAYGAGANPSQGLLNAANATQKHTQNINQYNTMAPQYQQMGYDVSKLDPRRGGGGIATTPEEFVKMKSLSDYRNQSLVVRQNIADAGDNTRRAKMIMDGFTNGIFSEGEAIQQAALYGMNINDLKASNQTRNANVNEQVAPSRIYANYAAPQIASGRLGLQQQEFNVEKPLKEAQTLKLLEELGAGGIPLKERTQMQRGVQAVESQVDRFTNTFKGLPTKVESYTAGQARRLTGMQTPAEANFNSQRTLLFNKIARELGGEKGVLSDQDIQRINEALPNLTDSYQQKQAKMQAVYDLMGDVKNRYGMTQGSGNRIQPFVPNANLTPIPRNAIGGGQVRPRQTSKPKAKAKGGMDF